MTSPRHTLPLVEPSIALSDRIRARIEAEAVGGDLGPSELTALHDASWLPRSLWALVGIVVATLVGSMLELLAPAPMKPRRAVDHILSRRSRWNPTALRWVRSLAR